jgi:Flp pilus assembly protein TadG
MPKTVAGFLRDRRGASAVEFAMVASPFILLLMALLQMSIYFMAQFALDTGVTKTAQILQNTFNSGSSIVPSAATLKADVVSGAGGLISSSTAAVEIRQLTSLASGKVAIVDGTNQSCSTPAILVLRAQAQVMNFAPGFSKLGKVEASAVLACSGT